MLVDGILVLFERRLEISQKMLTNLSLQLTRRLYAGGWMVAELLSFEESPDSTKQRCRVTPGRGDPTESATENKPPKSFLG